MELKIAILECHPNRADYILQLIRNVNSSTKAKTFETYNKKFPDNSFDGYIITGGMPSLLNKRKYPHLKDLVKITKLLSKNKPMLGICLGHQIIAETFGGKIKEAEKLEVGFRRITLLKQNDLLRGLPKIFYAFNYHWDFVSRLPENFEKYAKSDLCKIHSIKHKTKPIYGIQFHPEFNNIVAKGILHSLRDEIIEEEIDFNKLIKDISLYSQKVSIQIMKNFLKIVQSSIK